MLGAVAQAKQRRGYKDLSFRGWMLRETGASPILAGSYCCFTLMMNKLPSAIALQTMKTASEYRKHAQECRALAQQVPAGEQRHQLLEMARTWDSLAEDRERLVRRHPELDTAKESIKAEARSK